MTSSLYNKPGWILLLEEALELNSHLVAQIFPSVFFVFHQSAGKEWSIKICRRQSLHIYLWYMEVFVKFSLA